jgi:hypothetical protein
LPRFGIFASNSGPDAVLIFSLPAGAAVAGDAAVGAVFAVVATGDGAEFTCVF